MKKLFLLFIFLFLFLAGMAVTHNLSQQLTNQYSKTPVLSDINKLRICPNQWYRNEQPCVYQNSPEECKEQITDYFIIEGKRKEIKEFDVDWIKKNCDVSKPKTIN